MATRAAMYRLRHMKLEFTDSEALGRLKAASIEALRCGREHKMARGTWLLFPTPQHGDNRVIVVL